MPRERTHGSTLVSRQRTRETEVGTSKPQKRFGGSPIDQRCKFPVEQAIQETNQMLLQEERIKLREVKEARNEAQPVACFGILRETKEDQQCRVEALKCTRCRTARLHLFSLNIASPPRPHDVSVTATTRSLPTAWFQSVCLFQHNPIWKKLLQISCKRQRRWFSVATQADSHWKNCPMNRWPHSTKYSVTVLAEAGTAFTYPKVHIDQYQTRFSLVCHHYGHASRSLDETRNERNYREC